MAHLGKVHAGKARHWKCRCGKKTTPHLTTAFLDLPRCRSRPDPDPFSCRFGRSRSSSMTPMACGNQTVRRRQTCDTSRRTSSWSQLESIENRCKSGNDALAFSAMASDVLAWSSESRPRRRGNNVWPLTRETIATCQKLASTFRAMRYH